LWNLEELRRIDPYDLEILVGELFEAMGYKTHVTPRSRDYGVDILVKIERLGLVHAWEVQVKRTRQVGVREVREYSSLRERDRVDGVIIVTTGYFTKEATEEAAQYNVKLIPGDLLTLMLNHYLPHKKSKPGKTTKKKTGEGKAKEKAVEGLVLQEDETVVTCQPVKTDSGKLELILTNRAIFLREKGGLFRRSKLHRKIPLSEVIATTQGDEVILLLERPEILTLKTPRAQEILELIDKFRAVYPGTRERIHRISRKKGETIILTNRRLIHFNRENNAREIKLHDILEVELQRKSLGERFLITVNGNPVEELELHVPGDWKKELEKLAKKGE